MVSKNQQKQIQQLAMKKFRELTQTFVVEGEKSVTEFFEAGWKANAIFATSPIAGLPTTLISEAEMKKITLLHSPSPVLAVFQIPPAITIPQNETLLVLDGVADPGNLGTLIRLADWFGIFHVVCSTNTVSCFNPKTVQASMGSLARVQCSYVDLATFLPKQQLPIYAAVLQGESIYSQPITAPAILLMGSEAHGISSELLPYANKNISIPSAVKGGAESLNVAIATAILLSEFHRTNYFTQK
jgi:TrmH family RNA methyltransferase